MELNQAIAVDANPVIDLIRRGGSIASFFGENRPIVLPLPVLGELCAGAYSSSRKSTNLSALTQVVDEWVVLSPDEETAHEYGRLRSRTREMPNVTQSRLNDLWIAALCIQHALPLLTNDRGFDVIPGLTVIHW